MPWLGLDIGGANIKLADGRGFAASQSFSLWQRPDDLARQLEQLINAAPASDQLAVTMTGELADCFATKAEGVRWIVDAVERAAAGRTARVYLTSGQLVSLAAARTRWDQAAAANWHAIASFSGRYADSGPVLLIDIGSTTCDVIPLQAGQPAAHGDSDTTRLINRELIYCGVARTPVCGLVDRLPWRGSLCPVAREWFATTHDVYLLTGDVPADPDNTATADGQPATTAAARTRLARMVCADADAVTFEEAAAMARAIAQVQIALIADGIGRVVGRVGQPPATVVVSGEGEFLARRAVERVPLDARVVSLGNALGVEVSRCAAAHAVAVLAAEDAA